MTYKIFTNQLNSDNIIIRDYGDGIKTSIPQNPENSDYQQFIQDVAEQGIGIVEGPDIIEPDYATLRQQE